MSYYGAPSYRPQYIPQASYRSIPAPPSRPMRLSPTEKKILMYTFLFIVVAIVVAVVLRSLSHTITGYYHSCSGGNSKKHNNCGSHEKHKPHDECGGSGQGSG